MAHLNLHLALIHFTRPHPPRTCPTCMGDTVNALHGLTSRSSTSNSIGTFRARVAHVVYGREAGGREGGRTVERGSERQDGGVAQ